MNKVRPRLIAVLPTMLTLGNAACGFGAITFAAKLGPTTDLSGRASQVAAALVFLGMLFDALDGSAARLTKATSELGAQLDSLCDAITFGVAPAFLMLQFVNHELGNIDIWIPETILARLLWSIAALYVICAVMRLARFNVETDEDDSHDEFSGLPSPAAAGAVVAFPLVAPYLIEWTESAVWAMPALRVGLPLVTLATACLMVSRIRYPHFFNQLFRRRKTRMHIIQMVFVLALVFQAHELALPLALWYFAFAAPIVAAWRRVVPQAATGLPQVSANGAHDDVADESTADIETRDIKG